MLGNKKGQAIFEIIPAVTVFGLVVTASMIYYSVLREQQSRLEAVRNLAFAMMNNSGPLTTVPEDWGRNLQVGDGGFDVKRRANNENVVRGDHCFRVIAEPFSETLSYYTRWPTVSQQLKIKVNTWAVIQRRPGGGCD